jgi:hypothetical protein
MKIKAIVYILLSYFQQNFLNIMGTVVAVILLLVASIASLVNPEAAVEKIVPIRNYFLVALLFILYVSAMQIKGLIKSNATALFPHYRRYLLMAFGLVLAVFLVWPVVIMGILGVSVLPCLAMFLFVSCLVLGGLFFLGDNLIALGVMIWLGKLVHEMLGFKSKVKIFGDFSDFSLLGSTSIFPLLVTVFSAVVLFLIALYLLKAPTDFSSKKTDISNPYAKDYDRTNALTSVIAKRNISLLLISCKSLQKKQDIEMTPPKERHPADREWGVGATRLLLKNNQDKKGSLFHIARLLQPGLFSPAYASLTQSLVGIPLLIFYLGTVFYVLLGIKFDLMIIPFLLLIYYMVAAMITTDFLQHRQRLPLIWMQAQLNSRKAFAKTIILTYVMVVVKQHLAVSLGMLIIPIFFPVVSVFRLLPLITLGFLVFIMLLSLSLLLSDQVLSPECKGWMLFNIMGGILGLTIAIMAFKLSFNNTPGTWMFIGVLAVITGLLLWRAYKKWSNTELNFIGPQV